MTQAGPKAKEQRLRICAASGLELTKAQGQKAWRVAQTKYGPLDPQARPQVRPGTNVDAWKSWQRWDVPGHRTVYAADSKKVAYAEVLGWFKRQLADQPGTGLDLSKYLDDIPDAASGWNEVSREWGNHLPPYTLPASWRNERLMYRVTVPTDGWFTNVSTLQSMSAIEKAIGPQLALLAVSQMDLSLLTSDRREVTCEISEWVHGLKLDDGNLPHGIAYPSRHGGERCWAIWLRRIDDGLDPASELTTADHGAEIRRDDPDFKYILGRFGLKCF
jgi:RES domain-containing protein